MCLGQWGSVKDVIEEHENVSGEREVVKNQIY